MCELSLEYATRHRRHVSGDYHRIYWLHQTTRVTIINSYVTATRLHCSYTVQWSSDQSFGSGSGEAKVSAPYDYGLDPDSWMTYTIDGVTHAEPTYVRVMASNAVGFSEPVAAVPHGWSQHEVRRCWIKLYD